MTVTIKDIARLIGVSHTTVSRALNDSPLINYETKERIKALAQEHGYTPNFNAKSLVLDRSYNIGLFFSTLNQGTSAVFFHETVRGVNSMIKDRYKLIVRGIDDYPNYNGITRKNYDGILVMSQSEADNAFIQHLLERDIPHVVLNRQVQGLKSCNIVSDDRQGVFQVMEHLIASGHQDIAIIEGRKGFQSSKVRKEGYLQALASHQITSRPELQVHGSYDVESGYQAMNTLLKLDNLPTAVFCSNDDMAVGAMKAIGEKGLHVPDDISVVGFDDHAFSGYLSPSLTTVKRPIEQISKLGVAKLIEQIETKQNGAETVYIHTELLLRESTRKMTTG